MSFLLKRYRPDNLAPGALVPNSLGIHNGIYAALTALQFPIYVTDSNTHLRSVTGTFESPHVMVYEIREKFEKTMCTILGRLQSEWRWEARLKFNNQVLGDQIFGDLAGEPIALTAPVDANSRMDGQRKAYLVSVDHVWRPSQDAGPGSSFDLTFEVRSH